MNMSATAIEMQLAAGMLRDKCHHMTAAQASDLCGISLSQCQALAAALGEQFREPPPDRVRLIRRAVERVTERMREAEEVDEVVLE